MPATSPILTASMDSEPQFEQLACLTCGGFFTTPVAWVGGRKSLLQYHCDPCREGIELEAENRRQQVEKVQMESRDKRWPSIVLAPCYVETDITHPGIDAAALHAANRWRPGPRGLGLVGESRRGKTRCLHLALKKAWDAGRNCLAVREVDFASVAESAAFGTRQEQRQSREFLWNWKHIGVLLLDDVGKARANPAVSQELYGMLDYRATHGLPTLWSAQAGSTWITDKYGPDHGPAIAARLGKEFCDVTALPSSNPEPVLAI